MKLTLEQAQAMMDNNGGWLDLSDTQITSLPEGLTVGGSLDLRGTQITSLPKGLTVGGSLYLSGTQITSLPDGLTVGGWLDLSGTQITSLPEGLTVGCSLDLSGTQITSLPKGLTVGGSLYLRGTQIENFNKVKILTNGDYVPGRYLYADNILAHVRGRKTVNGYVVYIGRIKGRNVVSDGEYYAHCDKLSDGIADIAFKRADKRGAEQYKGMSLDTVLTVDEAVTMYRVITGACRQGSAAFVASLGDSLKEKYTIREAIELTKGQFNSERFAEFFEAEV